MSLSNYCSVTLGNEGNKWLVRFPSLKLEDWDCGEPYKVLLDSVSGDFPDESHSSACQTLLLSSPPVKSMKRRLVSV